MRSACTTLLPTVLLLCLASCGRAQNKADDAVTVRLPPAKDQVQQAGRRLPATELAGQRLSTSDDSHYTSLEGSSCTPNEHLPEQPELTRRRCSAVGGYEVEVVNGSSGDRLAIVAPNGRRSELDLTRAVPHGTLGKLAEWRGETSGDPRAVIVRVALARKPAVSSLVVAKLQPDACVVAVIARGPRQNERARAVADRANLRCEAQ